MTRDEGRRDLPGLGTVSGCPALFDSDVPEGPAAARGGSRRAGTPNLNFVTVTTFSNDGALRWHWGGGTAALPSRLRFATLAGAAQSLRG
jgi:hypothetical protein